MKIERINENQFRCTLTESDLADRKINLLELAYGTPKARSLFHDLMEQAFTELGFEAEDIPLMIEAVPLGGESIMLIVTKIEDPEELDTRFSRFTPSSLEEETEAAQEGADDILELFRLLSGAKAPAENQEDTSEAPRETPALTRIFSFPDLDSVCRAACILQAFYHGESSLYKDPKEKQYYLILKKAAATPEDFNRACNILSEYSSPMGRTAALDAHLQEHFSCMIPQDAVEKLSKI